MHVEFRKGLLRAKAQKGSLSLTGALLVHALGTEKSLSWYIALEFGASCLSGLLAFGRSGPLDLVPAQMGALWDQKMPGPPGA